VVRLLWLIGGIGPQTSAQMLLFPCLQELLRETDSPHTYPPSLFSGKITGRSRFCWERQDTRVFGLSI